MRRFVFGSLAAMTCLAASVSAGPTRTLEELFKVMDINDDSRLTRSEFVGEARGEEAKRASRQFDKLDRDGSESLTFEEFATRRNRT